MGETYIYGNENSKSWCASIGVFVPFPIMSLNETSKIHEFVIKNVKDVAPESKIVIDLDSIDPALALTIAMHLRLSVDSLKENILLPILLVSNLPILTFLSLGECSQFFLARKGYAICSPEDVQYAIKAVEGLTISEYKTDFLDKIHILPDATVGRHSIANQWGAEVLAHVANIDYERNADLINAQRSLYFKYVFAKKFYSDNSSDNNEISIIDFNCDDIHNKKVLLIDDEANCGWVQVLKKVLGVPDDNFDLVDYKVSEYKEIKDEIIKNRVNNDYYDLYLLDLRLMGNVEEDIVITKNFSGYRILDYLIKKNKGNQVIILTASNKAWNLKNLIDAGASGYYIKESPELMLPLSFSKKNYESLMSEINSAFENKFKRKLYRDIYELQKNLRKSKRLKIEGINEELNGVLWKTFIPFMVKVKTKEDFVAAYILLYSVFEILERHYESKLQLKGGKNMTNIINQLYEDIGNGDGLYARIQEVVDARNDFIHPKKSKTPPDFIYNHEGLDKLFSIISKVLYSLS